MIRGLWRAISFARSWRGGASNLQQEELELHRGDRSAPASLLLPGSSSSPLPGWVILHGITRPGRHHPTLVQFVRALAGTGACALVPDIPEWRELYLAPDEAEATIRAAVDYLEGRPEVDPGRLGIMGFSLGVPQVLLAATDPALKGRIKGVAGFGGYGDLDRTMRFLFRGEHEWQGTAYRTDPDPYGRWVVGGNYLNRIAGHEEATDVAEALLNLARQAGDLQVGAWEARYDVLKETLLEGIHPSRRSLFQIFAPPSGQRPSTEATDALAPALAAAAREAAPHSDPRSSSEKISIPVCLVHGRGDRLIPFTESLRLAQAFPGKARVRVYLTGLFSHSQADSEGTRNSDFGEQLHFLRILAELLTLVD